jgi:quercetin dioxygenase-like cupin family protein
MGCAHAGEFVSGNIFIRQALVGAAKGDQIVGDVHNFDHTTYVVSGSIHVHATAPDGTTREVTKSAGQWVLIKADVKHTITALEDGTTVHCVYAHRTPQGEVVQEFTGWETAYR